MRKVIQISIWALGLVLAGGALQPCQSAPKDPGSKTIADTVTPGTKNAADSSALDGKSPPNCTIATGQGTDQNAGKTYLFCKQGVNSLKGLHFGAGILYTPSLGGVGPVAVINDGMKNVVHVTKQNASAARAAFELHYFFEQPPSTNILFNGVGWAFGPFISLNTRPLDDLSGGQVFSSLGAGVMFGFNAFDNPTDGGVHSFNLGIGMLVDTEVRQLGSGIADGQMTSLPVSASNDSLTRTATKTGFMAMFSYTFSLN